jgi:hypothetical protein
MRKAGACGLEKWMRTERKQTFFVHNSFLDSERKVME